MPASQKPPGREPTLPAKSFRQEQLLVMQVGKVIMCVRPCAILNGIYKECLRTLENICDYL